jgi:hypothetical protein
MTGLLQTNENRGLGRRASRGIAPPCLGAPVTLLLRLGLIRVGLTDRWVAVDSAGRDVRAAILRAVPEYRAVV